ncbi:CvpA family protein [Belliella pelovolcani]|uniref:Membrane protein required for colicin V production n=1 Tax=Belliella pelovolcani TaxID=529505 RepID=A0A1N7JK54_9BACT|nr:CvpA family protein [Belliella pelovolcani]SIS49699.1 membrane protein required for colicin V production [Belliella pelovolcani]
MATLDIIILAILTIGTYSGYKQGLFIGIISIVAFFLAILLAFQLMDWGAELLSNKVENLTFMLPFLAFLIIFLIVIISIRALAYLVKKTIDLTMLGSMDNVAGAILGILKTGFILSLLLWVANSFEFELSETWISESKVYPFLQPIAPFTINILDAYTPIVKEAVESIQTLVNTAKDAALD